MLVFIHAAQNRFHFYDKEEFETELIPSRIQHPISFSTAHNL